MATSPQWRPAFAVSRCGETRSQLAEFFARFRKRAGLMKTRTCDLVTLGAHLSRCRAAAYSGRTRRVSIACARRVPTMWIEDVGIVPSVFTLSIHRCLNNMHLLNPSLGIVVAIALMKEPTWTFFIHGRFCGFCLYSFWRARFLSFQCFSASSRSSPMPRIGRKRQWRAAPASRSLDAGPGTYKPTVAHSRPSPMERSRQ
jgi:hypothetical protein